MDIALILDLSGSVESVRDLILKFAEQFVGDLPIGSDLVRLALINYADDVDVGFYLDTYTSKRAVMNALVATYHSGRTGTAAAVRMMYDQVFTTSRGDRRNVDNYAIVVSDGGSNIEREKTIPSADEAKQRGITMFSVAIGPTPDMGEMEGMANTPSSEYLVRLRTSSDTQSASQDLISKLCA
eukprot:GHVO01041937.1.p1 GENE.GHVO01041937.1~~GHVO01041937.1.p1  ORF type:complete len:183 (+),score=19.16 GHVO01041937.1:634-1182(+)